MISLAPAGPSRNPTPARPPALPATASCVEADRRTAEEQSEPTGSPVSTFLSLPCTLTGCIATGSSAPPSPGGGSLRVPGGPWHPPPGRTGGRRSPAAMSGARAGRPVTPARASLPRPGSLPAPSMPRCHGNQPPPADRAAGVVPFLFMPFGAYFCIHFLGSRRPLPPGLSPAVTALCVGCSGGYYLPWPRSPSAALRPPRQSRQRAPLRALILSSQLDLLPHEGEKPRETESVCLRGAEPAPWVSESRSTPDGHQLLPGGNRLRLAHPRPRGPATGTVCGPCGGHSCVFGGGAERGAPGQVPLSSLPSGGRWVPTAREGCSGVHCVPQHSRGHHVEQARPQGH